MAEITDVEALRQNVMEVIEKPPMEGRYLDALRAKLEVCAETVKAAGLIAVRYRGAVAAHGIEIDHTYLAIFADESDFRTHAGAPSRFVDVLPLKSREVAPVLGDFVWSNIDLNEWMQYANERPITDRVCVEPMPSGVSYYGKPVFMSDFR